MVSVLVIDCTHALISFTHSCAHTPEISTLWPAADEKKNFDRSRLPTAPRSASQADIDPRRLPSKPPYTIYLGNLSYECTEEDVLEFFERKKLSVSLAHTRLTSTCGTVCVWSVVK